MLGIDPWLIDPYFGVCGKIDFQERAGEECLASNVSFLLEKIRAKYAEYGIAREALRDRQGRRRHLRHGHHDRARRLRRSPASTASSATRWRS